MSVRRAAFLVYSRVVVSFAFLWHSYVITRFENDLPSHRITRRGNGVNACAPLFAAVNTYALCCFLTLCKYACGSQVHSNCRDHIAENTSSSSDDRQGLLEASRSDMPLTHR